MNGLDRQSYTHILYLLHKHPQIQISFNSIFKLLFYTKERKILHRKRIKIVVDILEYRYVKILFKLNICNHVLLYSQIQHQSFTIRSQNRHYIQVQRLHFTAPHRVHRRQGSLGYLICSRWKNTILHNGDFYINKIRYIIRLVKNMFVQLQKVTVLS